MDYLQQRVAELNAFARSRPRPDRIRKVQEGLKDKFEGIQGAAVRVLGAWGDAESIALLQAFLIKAFERSHGWAIRSAAMNALRPHINRHDVDWLLDLYFSLPTVLTKHEVWPLVLVLPPEAARQRLIAALSDPVPENRQAAVKAIANMSYPDRLQLVSPLRDDQSALVRKTALAFQR